LRLGSVLFGLRLLGSWTGEHGKADEREEKRNAEEAHADPRSSKDTKILRSPAKKGSGKKTAVKAIKTE
jgi:hypothetical protein